MKPPAPFLRWTGKTGDCDYSNIRNWQLTDSPARGDLLRGTCGPFDGGVVSLFSDESVAEAEAKATEWKQQGLWGINE